MDRVKKMVHYWCDDIKKAGLTGKGVTVAVLDTGLAPHPDFFTHLSYDILANYWGVNSDTIRGGNLWNPKTIMIYLKFP